MHTDSLADKAGRRGGGGGGGEENDGETEGRTGRSRRKLGNPPHLSFTSLPLFSLSVNEFTHKPWRESDFTRSQESWTTPPPLFCVFVHPFTSPHTHFSVYRLPVHPFLSVSVSVGYNTVCYLSFPFNNKTIVVLRTHFSFLSNTTGQLFCSWTETGRKKFYGRQLSVKMTPDIGSL